MRGYFELCFLGRLACYKMLEETPTADFTCLTRTGVCDLCTGSFFVFA